jgi:hypothetical protein
MIDPEAKTSRSADATLRRVRIWIYRIVGPPGVYVYGSSLARELGRPAGTAESSVVDRILGFIYLFAPIASAVPLLLVAIFAAVIMRRDWREALPLWFLAAGCGGLLAFMHGEL